MRHFRLGALIAMLSGVVWGETSAGWRFWDASDGLAESYTKGVAASGPRIWLQHGDLNLDLLDGYRNSHPAHPHSVGPLRALPDGTLWLWTGTQLKQFRLGVWRAFTVPEVTGYGTLRLDSQQNWIVTSSRDSSLSAELGLAAVSTDRVLILLPDRILEFDAGRGSALEVLGASQTRLGRFLEISPSRSDGIWVTGRSGLGRLLAGEAPAATPPKAAGGWHWEPFGRPPPAEFSEFRQFFEAGNGDLYVTAGRARGNSVLRYAEGKWQIAFSSRSANLRGWPGHDSVVWIQDGNRIVYMAGGRTHTVEKLSALAGVVLAIRPEDDGAFWVGTSQGAARFGPPLWQAPAELEQIDEVVSAITEDRQRRVWFASASELISVDDRTWHVYPLPVGQQTWPVYTDSMAALPDGRIAIRSVKDSPLLFDPRSERFEVLRHPAGRELRVFVSHPEGLLVQTCSTRDGSRFRLEIYDGKTFRTVLEDSRMRGPEDLRTIRIDRAGNIWLGDTLGCGVYRNGRFEPQGRREGYNDRGCFLVYEAPNGVLYAGGRDSLSVRENGNWRLIHSGLDRTRSIMMSHDGTVWVASGTGVHRYRDGKWLTNGEEEGLPSSFAYRVFEDSRGRIWAATTRGIARYYPHADVDPPITLIAEDQNSRQVSPSGDVRLVFSGMDKWKQTPIERLLYSWRLDGGSWQPFSSERSVLFRGLPAGPRRFEVRAMDRNGNVDPHAAQFAFAVLPAWYRDTTFQGIAGISLASIVGLLALAVLSFRQRGRLIAELHRKKRLESDRQTILEMVARRKTLPVIFERIARAIAVSLPGTHAGVIRFNPGGLKVAENSALPPAFVREIEAISTPELDFDELWSSLHQSARDAGLAVSHFAPIRSGGDELLGAIAVVPRPGARGVVDVPLVATMSNLAGAAIDSARLYERLAFQAEHDALTGLPNRLMFETRLQQALLRAQQQESMVAVFFLDLDRFKQINDTLGHRAGDMFLKQVAKRLSGRIPAGQTLARVGGDEFTLVLCQQPGARWIEETAERMLESLEAPIPIEGQNLFASASIGISVFPQDGEDYLTLQKHADLAMYRAKQFGKNRYEIYSTDAQLSGSAALEPAPVRRGVLR